MVVQINREISMKKADNVSLRYIGRAGRVAIAAIAFGMSVAEIHADTNITENTTLEADADWSEFGTVTIAEGVTLDLKGHSLTVSGIGGQGTITDSYASEYERIEYLQSSGSQFIDTGHYHDANTEVDLRLEFLDLYSGSYCTVYGSRNTGNNNTQLGCWLNKGNFMTDTCTKTAKSSTTTPAALGEIYDVHISKSGANTVTGVNNTKSYDLGTGNGVSGTNVNGNDYIFAMRQNGGVSWYTKMKLYSCQVYSSGEKIRDFVPVRRTSDDTLGLLDIVNGTFYVNGGSGAFTAGETAVFSRLIVKPNAASSTTFNYDFSELAIGTITLSIQQDGALAADMDLRKFVGLEVADGTTLDLAGHKLYVNGLSGEGTVTDATGTLDGYERIEYLQSSGSQFIDTGHYHDANTEVDLRLEFLDLYSGGYCTVYGSRNSNKNNTQTQLGCWLNKGNFMTDTCTQTAKSSTTTPAALGEIYDVHISKSGANTVTGVNNTKSYDLGTGNGVSGTNVNGNDYIFAIRQDGSAEWKTKMKLYSCQVYSSGVQIRDFVPVRRTSDDTLGLLDVVGGKFYVNGGTDAFTAGADVETSASGELHVCVAEGEQAKVSTSIVGALKLVKEGVGSLVIGGASSGYAGGTEVAAGTLRSADGASVMVGAEGTSFAVAGDGAVDFNGNGLMNVHCYELAAGAKALNSGDDITDYDFEFKGAYTPVDTGAYPCILLGDAVLDLSAWDGDWPMDRDIEFENGATITVNLAGRTDLKTLARSESPYVMTWTTAPTGVTFLQDADSKDLGVSMAVKSDGLALVSCGMIIFVR